MSIINVLKVIVWYISISFIYVLTLSLLIVVKHPGYSPVADDFITHSLVVSDLETVLEWWSTTVKALAGNLG